MTIRHAANLLSSLIHDSHGTKKSNYISLLELVTEGKFFSRDSKKILRKLNFRTSFIENITFLISIQNEDSYHFIRIYRSKHGTLSLINVSKLGKGPRQSRGCPHPNNC